MGYQKPAQSIRTGLVFLSKDQAELPEIWLHETLLRRQGSFFQIRKDSGECTFIGVLFC